MKKFKEIDVKIEDTKFPGVGIGHYNDKIVYVKNTLKGDSAHIKVTKSKKDYMEGKVVSNIRGSFKRDSICDKQDRCGGCAFIDVDYPHQLEEKEYQVLKLFQESNIHDFEYLGIEKSPSEFNYRNKMEFTFGDMSKGGELTLGLHVKNSPFSIISTCNCKLVDDDFNLILEKTLEYFRNADLPYYKVMKREGYLRNLVIRKGINSNEVLVNLVTTSQIDFDLNEYVELILGLNIEGLKGILHTVNDSLSDVVQADKVNILWGKDFFIENICGLKFKISPFAFFQTNSKGTEVLYSIVKDFIGNEKNKVLFDLYCGTGTIGQVLSNIAKEVIGVEIVEEAVESAVENTILNGITNCEFIAGDVKEVIKNIDKSPDTIVLDPPRTGVHKDALKTVINFSPKEIVYVSCNPKTLTDDLRILIDGGYRLDKVKLMDMFPQTPHVETVCLLEKISK